MERDLVRQDGLAGTGTALDNVRRTFDEPPIEDLVKTLDPARNPRELLHCQHSCLNALI